MRRSGRAAKAPHFLQRQIVGDSLLERLQAIAKPFEHRSRRRQILRGDQHVAVAARAGRGKRIEVVGERRALEQQRPRPRRSPVRRAGRRAPPCGEVPTSPARSPDRADSRYTAGPVAQLAALLVQQSGDAVIGDSIDDRRLAIDPARRPVGGIPAQARRRARRRSCLLHSVTRRRLRFPDGLSHNWRQQSRGSVSGAARSRTGWRAGRAAIRPSCPARPTPAPAPAPWVR